MKDYVLMPLPDLRQEFDEHYAIIQKYWEMLELGAEVADFYATKSLDGQPSIKSPHKG